LRGDAPRQRPGPGRAGRGRREPVLARVQPGQGRVQPGGRGHDLAHGHKDAETAEHARGEGPQIHRWPPFPAVTRLLAGRSSRTRNRPGTGMVPSRYSQARPPAYSPVTMASTTSPATVP